MGFGGESAAHPDKNNRAAIRTNMSVLLHIDLYLLPTFRLKLNIGSGLAKGMGTLLE
jgi:hypothetical protein